MHHDLGGTLLEIRIEDRVSGRAPAWLSLQKWKPHKRAQDSPGNIHRQLCVL